MKTFLMKTILLLTCLMLMSGLGIAADSETRVDLAEPGDTSVEQEYAVNTDKAAFISLGQDEKPGTFRHAHEIFTSNQVPRGDSASVLPWMDAKPDISYQFSGEVYSLSNYAERNFTTGIIVLKGGEIAYEEYLLGADESSLFTSFSVGKSIVGALVGLAVADGSIESFEDKLTDYLPHYKDSGYKNVTIKQALQMSSGVEFNENYTAKGSQFHRLFNNGMVNQSESFKEIMSSMSSAYSPGTVFNYSSGESTVLSELVSAATGKTASEYLADKIWSRIGMQSDAFWLADKTGMEFGAGSLSITLRDYARFGLLMLNDGMHDGIRILPKGWVAEATVSAPDSPHLQPGQLYEGFPLGYQYQWWTFPNGAYAARGVFGQWVYVNPATDIVVIITSVWPAAESPENMAETLAMLQGVDRSFR